MPPPPCAAPQCDHPAHGGHLCTSCVATLHRDLAGVPDLLADLDVTISRQDRITTPTPTRRHGEHPLPLRLGPMEARRDLTDTLCAWSDHLAARRGTHLTGHDPAHRAHWLLDHLGDAQDDLHAGDLADEIGYAVITAQRAVDKPLQHRYAGPCEACGGDLYAHPRAREVTCRDPGCDATYEVAARRQWLLTQTEDQLLTATGMSRALPGLIQEPLTAATIRGWARRGRITAHPPLPDRPRDPTYRVGDVIAVIVDIRAHADRPRAG